MPRRLFASLLFCVALFAQLAAPLARGVALAQGGATKAAGFVVLCKLLHGDAKAPGGHERPRGAGLHDHSCSLCQTGANVAPLPPEQAPFAGHALFITHRAAVKTRDRVASRLFTRGPPARAPPAFVQTLTLA